MKLFKSLLAVALLAAGTTAFAQTREMKVTERTEQKVVSQDVSYEFNKHAFLDLQGGAQYTLGEAKFSKLISPNVQLGLGYQFSPVFGARIAANAWQSRGGWNGYGSPSLTADYKYKYVAPGIDLMFNLSNLFSGWNPNRVFNLIAFIGGGANIAFSNGEVNDIAKNLKADLSVYELEYLWDGTKVRPVGRAGLEAAFRLSPVVSLMLEGNANILSDKYNSKKAGNPDWYFNGLIGLRFNLGADAKKVVKDVYGPVVVYDTTYVDVPAPVKKLEPIRRDIFFTINSTVISETEAVKVKDIADYLAKYPKAKVVVSGYADKGTGNAQINARLAAGRADVVVTELKEKYGVAEDRITYNSYGDTVQPFAENDLNRVSICIANPE